MNKRIITLILIVFMAGIAVKVFESINDRHGRVGMASWYGDKWRGRKTANGERFDPDKLTAAHRLLPFGTVVMVTNLENGLQVRVVINDRGPHINGRIIDLSRAAARKLGMIEDGLAKVKLRIMPKELGSTVLSIIERPLA
ncbi:MAG: septal ring lytic transglycosylase RlpA family protein [Candidatus Omnitrophota bacterium]